MQAILKDIVGAIDADAIKISGSDDSIRWFDEWLHHARKAINGKSDSEIRIFREGMSEGLRMFAWWKDGRQWVGTCGCTLKQALAEVDEGKFDNLGGSDGNN